MAFSEETKVFITNCLLSKEKFVIWNFSQKEKNPPQDQNCLYFQIEARASLFFVSNQESYYLPATSLLARSKPSASVENRTILGNLPLSSLMSLLCIRWRLYIMFLGSRWEEQLVWEEVSSLTTVKLRRVCVCMCVCEKSKWHNKKISPEIVNLTVCSLEQTVCKGDR